MKAFLIVVGLLVAGAVLWTQFGGTVKDTTAGALRDTANRIGYTAGRK